MGSGARQAGKASPLDEAVERARRLVGKGRLAEARKILDKAEKAPAVFRAYAAIAIVEGDWDKAADCLDEALEIDMEDPESLGMMAEVLLQGFDDAQQAIGHLMLALGHAPGDARLMQRFLDIAGGQVFAVFNPHVAEALSACLAAPDIHIAGAERLWFSTFSTHPDFAAFFAQGKEYYDISFNPGALDSTGDHPRWNDPFLLRALRRMVVCHPAFEDFVRHLRRALLEGMAQSHVPLAAAVAEYCFSTEYIMDTRPEEDEKIAALRARLESGAETAPGAFAVYACYAPLSHLANAQGMADRLKDAPELEGIIFRQLTEYFTQREIRKEIPLLTPIEDAVTRKVREQYEEFPYPRWETFSTMNYPPGEGDSERGEGKDILIAGCGTGQQVAFCARRQPDARILAVDISLSSLAYAVDKTRGFGFSTVEFGQADILALGTLGRKFDSIFCTGVLHHMDDPEKGWEVLLGLLNPGGVMMVALYSETARRYYVEAQEAAARGGFTGERDSMKRFRREHARHISAECHHALVKTMDYYYMSMYRDLLFHAREHRYTLPGLKAALGRLGLAFGGFRGLPPRAEESYRKMFPQDPSMLDLDNWHVFEQKNPDTFLNMYTFMCGKKTEEQ